MTTTQGFLEVIVMYNAGEAYENQDVPKRELGDVDDKKKLKMLLNGDDYI